MAARIHHPPHMAPAHAALADAIIQQILEGGGGWDEAALNRAIKDSKVGTEAVDENLAHIVFPDLPKSLLVWGSGYGDAVMIETLEKNKPQGVTAIIFAGLMARYRHFAPYRTALKTAARLLSRPSNIITAGELTWATADRLWRAAGDTANDFNHYSKRGLLSGVIAATLPVYLGDNSAGLEKTEFFLRRRLDNIKTINRLKDGFLSRAVFGGGARRS